jgi:hypothetical protein
MFYKKVPKIPALCVTCDDVLVLPLWPGKSSNNAFTIVGKNLTQLVTKTAAHNLSLVKFLDIPFRKTLLSNNIDDQDTRVLCLLCHPRFHNSIGGPGLTVNGAVPLRRTSFGSGLADDWVRRSNPSPCIYAISQKYHGLCLIYRNFAEALRIQFLSYCLFVGFMFETSLLLFERIMT